MPVLYWWTPTRIFFFSLAVSLFEALPLPRHLMFVCLHIAEVPSWRTNAPATSLTNPMTAYYNLRKHACQADCVFVSVATWFRMRIIIGSEPVESQTGFLKVAWHGLFADIFLISSFQLNKCLSRIWIPTMHTFPQIVIQWWVKNTQWNIQS